MTRIAPVRLTFNPKTLWFDANGLDLSVGDDVVVKTARGRDLGRVSDSLFEMDYEDTKKLKSPLKPVERLATEEDLAHGEELAELAREALPTFRRLAEETVPSMNPIAVEYLFGDDKAVFYFESEERVDFRDLVRKLAAELHVRVDMKQIGVRDGARMVGGLGHCGQELCCRRLGGEFNPVSIRMAKEQDLSLNPQKISGTCGRLMCCLRYEYEAYKEFHGRAPKKNAKIQTPDGEGKVVDMDVPREMISIKVGTEKPVKVPLADMDAPDEGSRPNAVGEEAWERANEPVMLLNDSAALLFSNELTGEDKLAKPGTLRHVHGEPEEKPSRSRSRRRGGSGKGKSSDQGGRSQQSEASSSRKPRRRRSTTVKSDGSTQVEKQAKAKTADSKQEAAEQQKKSSSRRRRSRGGGNKQQGQGAQPAEQQQKKSQVGRNSSALRANRAEGEGGSDTGKQQGGGSNSRRRRRSHKTNSEGNAQE